MHEIDHLIEERKKLENLVDITFYIPCFNEDEAIYRTLEKLSGALEKLELSYQMLIFNDASTDNTLEEIKRFITNYPDVFITIVTNDIRRGLGYNYIAGSYMGVGKYYMMICGDDSETTDSIVDILDKRSQADIIVPYFGLGDQRQPSRRILSKTFTFIVNCINGYNINYYNGVVLHQRANVMRFGPTSSGFGYQAELIGILLDHGKTFKHVAISNQDRKQGISRAFHIQNVFSVTHSLLQIFLRRVRNTIWPMK